MFGGGQVRRRRQQGRVRRPAHVPARERRDERGGRLARRAVRGVVGRGRAAEGGGQGGGRVQVQPDAARRGIDILFGQVPETGVILDAKKEALRIRKNKSLGQKINSTPSPAIEKNSGKSVLIK